MTQHIKFYWEIVTEKLLGRRMDNVKLSIPKKHCKMEFEGASLRDFKKGF